MEGQDLKLSEYLKMINHLIGEEKMEYAFPVYNLQNSSKLDDTEVQFTVSDSNFMEMLLMRIRGENIKFASVLK